MQTFAILFRPCLFYFIVKFCVKVWSQRENFIICYLNTGCPFASLHVNVTMEIFLSWLIPSSTPQLNGGTVTFSASKYMSVCNLYEKFGVIIKISVL